MQMYVLELIRTQLKRKLSIIFSFISMEHAQLILSKQHEHPQTAMSKK